MADDRWHTSAEDVADVIAWLRGPVAASAPGSSFRPPRLHDVWCTHIEDGFVHLTFVDWPLHAARALADQLLHPDALLVSDPVSTFLGTSAPAFEGFGWDDEPPAAVLARHPDDPPPPGSSPDHRLRAAAGSPTSSTAPTGATDWGERHLS